MDLWFDPNRQVIVDLNNWKDPHIFFWITYQTIWFYPRETAGAN